MLLLTQISQWVKSVVQMKPQCSLYYKNEKIRSCKNLQEAEQHIKQIYNTVSQKVSTNQIQVQIDNPKTWNKFRNSFKVDQDN
jgi:hypothetical protein